MHKRIRDLRRLAENEAIRDRSWHLTVSELSERLKEFDPDAEISAFVGNPRLTQGMAVIVVDRSDAAIEGQLVVETTEPVDLELSHSEFLKSGIEIDDVFGSTNESCAEDE